MRTSVRATSAGLAVLVAVVSTAALAGSQTPVHDGVPLCGTEPGAGPATPDDGVLRVATYNVLHTLEDYDDETLDRRVELVADALTAANPDIVGLQEVVNSANHGVVAQRIAGALSERTGDDWSWCYFQSNPHLPGEPDTGPGGIGGPVSQTMDDLARPGDAPWAEGLAIVSRGPITDRAAHRLPPRTAEAPVCQAEHPENPLAFATCAFDTRQILWAQVDTACGALDMFTSHLAHDQSSISEQIRLLQITDGLTVIDQLGSDGPTPDVYVGDFNTLEGSPVWQAAVDAGFVDSYRVASPDDPGFTSHQEIDEPSSSVTQRIDYVMARPGSIPIAPRDAEIIGDEPVAFAGSGGETVVWPSDHYGVVVTLVDEASCAPAAGDSAPAPVGEAAADVGSTPSTTPATGGGPSTDAVAVGLLAALAGVAMLRVTRLAA